MFLKKKKVPWYLFCKGTNLIIMAFPSWPHLSFITSQRPHLQIPSHWEFGFNRWIWGANIQPGSASFLSSGAVLLSSSHWNPGSGSCQHLGRYSAWQREREHGWIKPLAPVFKWHVSLLPAFKKVIHLHVTSKRHRKHNPGFCLGEHCITGHSSSDRQSHTV